MTLFKDVEQCIQVAGGVSKFQYIAFTLIVMGMVAGAFILYSIVYFTHVPPMQCLDSDTLEWNSCSSEDACKLDRYHWQVDKSSNENLNNWVNNIDLYCTGSFEMSMIGSMFFVGTFSGSFILPRAADIYGRKPLFLIGLALYIVDVIFLYFAGSLWQLYLLMFLGGISETGRYYVAYVYCVELMPKSVQDKTGLFIFLVFGFAMTYIAL